MTSKAAARVRKERKVTIETQSTVGHEDTTTRTILNPSATDSMRVDYFSMMRRWRVRLLQYGLRMTYDIAVPEPGATLREAHAQLAALDLQTSTPFAFALKATEVTVKNYSDLAATYGVSVPEPPQDWMNQRIGGAVQGLGELGKDESWHFYELTLDVPDGYFISYVGLDALIGNVDNADVTRNFLVFGYGEPPGLGTSGEAAFRRGPQRRERVPDRPHRPSEDRLLSAERRRGGGDIRLRFYAPPETAWDQWRFAVWQALCTMRLATPTTPVCRRWRASATGCVVDVLRKPGHL